MEKRLKQLFRNSTQEPLFIMLELSTSRYRLMPGEELMLEYDAAEDPGNDSKHGAPVIVEVIQEAGRSQLVVWTREYGLLRTDGREATMNDDNE